MKTWSRREILRASAGAVGLATAAATWWDQTESEFALEAKAIAKIPVRLFGPSASAGHRLRDGFSFPAPSAKQATGVLIIGGGMAGLSAGWRLKKRGVDFKILELESEVGGNSRAGENAVSKYPWGAHYLTLLNDEASDARELYRDLGIITGEKDGRSVYDDFALCAAPHERLFIYDKWQEGLLPKTATVPEDFVQYKSFSDHLEEFRLKKGRDGRFVFALPLDYSSRDPEFLALDDETMTEYMRRHGWTSKPLHWYVNYCCRDDYGTPSGQTSAWAGLHYFCSRRGRADGAEDGILTWPDGNGHVVGLLRKRLQDHIVTDAMGFNVKNMAGGIVADAWNEKQKTVTQWSAASAILAMPRFVIAHMGPDLQRSQAPLTSSVSYAPWVVANVTLASLPEATVGAPLAWDNVFYDNDSLGYVVATHQIPQIHTGATVLTYYRPLDHLPPSDARKEAMAKTAGEWKTMILNDLALAHPLIAEKIMAIDVWIWGHAMVRPTRGYIWGAARKKMQEPIGKIHFAHSDMSGISIFEEAHFHGVRAADEVIAHAFT